MTPGTFVLVCIFQKKMLVCISGFVLQLELACDDDPGDGDEASKGSSVRYGSFHRHYYLDGKTTISILCPKT